MTILLKYQNVTISLFLQMSVCSSFSVHLKNDSELKKIFKNIFYI